MNKCEFLKEVSRNCGVSFQDCKKVFETQHFILGNCLKRGDDISLKGFGRFYVKTRMERLFKDVYSDKKVLLPIKNVVAFKMSKKFKNSID